MAFPSFQLVFLFVNGESSNSMIYISKEAYDYVKVVGNDVIVGGDIDGRMVVNRLYALYRNDKVVAYTMRQIVTSGVSFE